MCDIVTVFDKKGNKSDKRRPLSVNDRQGKGSEGVCDEGYTITVFPRGTS